MNSRFERREIRGWAQGLIISLIATLLVLVSPSVTPSFANGLTLNDGTCQLSGAGNEGSPYLVSNAAELYESTDCAINSTVVVKLTQNIALDASASQVPIGFSDSSTVGRSFSGVLDGDGFSITGINISYSLNTSLEDVNFDQQGVGLFWGLRDSTFRDTTFEGSVSGFDGRVGGIVGSASAVVTISNVVLDIDVTASGSQVGGFAGNFESRRAEPISVNNLTKRGNVYLSGSSQSYMENTGGFFGRFGGSLDIVSSSNEGNVVGSRMVGGFVGRYVNGDFPPATLVVLGSENSGNVSGDRHSIGGFTGFQITAFVIDSSTNSGNISATSTTSEWVGGFIGNSVNATTSSIIASFNTGDIAGQEQRFGGFIGQTSVRDLLISGSENLGDVRGNSAAGTDNTLSVSSRVGGFVGEANSTSIISSVNRGSLTLGRQMGGFIGYANGFTTISASLNTADIAGFSMAPFATNSDHIGGFVGYGFAFSVFASLNEGDISGAQSVGGFAGRAWTVSVVLSANSGDVSGVNEATSGNAAHVGGFVGFQSGWFLVQASTNSGAITGLVVGPVSMSGEIGGFFGDADTGSFVASANTGNVLGSDSVGGFIGNSDGFVTFSNSTNFGDVDSNASTRDSYHFGGFVGIAESQLAFVNSSNEGNISAIGDAVGGFLGETRDDVLISSSHNSGHIQGDDEVGGFVGQGNTLSITITIYHSSNTGNITGVYSDSSEIGGFIGDSENVRIERSINSGNVSGNYEVGGFIGYADGDVVILYSINSGNIVGTSTDSFDLAGFIGENDSSVRIFESLSSGDVTGYEKAAGLIAHVDGETWVSNSLVTAAVSGFSFSGGIFGHGVSDVHLTNVLFAGTLTVNDRTVAGALVASTSGSVSASASYWALAANSDLAPAPAGVDYTQVDSGYLAPAAAYNAASYINWDFTTIWGFGDCSVNNGLPTLRFAVPGATFQTQTGTCFVADNSVPATTYVGPVIQGPVIQSVTPSVASEGTAQIRGARLETITKVYVGGQEVPFTLDASNNLISFVVPKLNPGVYQTVFFSALAQVNLTGKITIMGEAEDITKVNVGSFNGKLVVYALNLDGSRITWKVGGIWGQDFAVGNQLNRFDRLTPRKGVTVKVDIYVDGEKRMTKNVLTR